MASWRETMTRIASTKSSSSPFVPRPLWLYVARAQLAIALDAIHVGENRYLWERVASAPDPGRARALVLEFLERLDIRTGRILDKPTNRYRVRELIEALGLRHRTVVLTRDRGRIEESRDRFAHRVLDPRRTWMRIKMYHRAYGLHLFLPIVSRWYYIPHALGFGRKFALSTSPLGSARAEFSQFE